MKKISIAILCLMLAIIVGGAVLYWGINNFTQSRQLYAERKAAGEKLAAKAAILAKIDKYQQEQDVGIAVGGLPIQVPYQQALAIISKLAAEGQLILTQLDLSGVKEGVAVKLEVYGSLSQIESFTDKMEKILPVVAVGQYDISQGDKFFILKEELLVNYKIPPVGIGKASDPLPVLGSGESKILNQLKGYELIGGGQTSSSEGAEASASAKLFSD